MACGGECLSHKHRYLQALTNDVPFYHHPIKLADRCDAAGPVISLGTEGGSVGNSYQATVGLPLIFSCNIAAAMWKKGTDIITDTDAMSRVFVMTSDSETILNFSPFQTTDGGMYACAFNESFQTSVTLSESKITCMWLWI